MSDPQSLDLPAEGFAKLPAVMRATGLSRSSIYERMKSGDFPTSVDLGARAVAWDVADVRAWIAARREAARKPETAAAGSR
jgi:prophage regulatory protein